MYYIKGYEQVMHIKRGDAVVFAIAQGLSAFVIKYRGVNL